MFKKRAKEKQKNSDGIIMMWNEVKHIASIANEWITQPFISKRGGTTTKYRNETKIAFFFKFSSSESEFNL